MTVLHGSRDVWEADEVLQAPEEHHDGLLGFINVLLRHRWWIAAGALLFGAAAVTSKLLSPRTFTSTSRFVPEAGRSRVSDLSGLAAQFGVSLDGSRDSYSPQFYIDLVRSAVILRQAVDHRYTFPTDAGPTTATLVEHYEIAAQTPERSRELAVRTLGENLRTELAVKTGVVEISVKASNPTLAAQINQRLLDLLNRFNAETRRSRAAAERAFVDERLRVLATDLRAAEERTESFLRRNRQLITTGLNRSANSPELQFEHERHLAAVSLLRQVHGSLAQALEQAKIDEIRDTPVLTVVQPPVPPRWPDSRGTLKTGVLALMLGALVGLGFGFLRDEWRLRLNSPTKESMEFRALVQTMIDDLRRFFFPRRKA